ncbi:MAG: methyltransferase domain-containing protein [bacterium]|nr:methyltransferase domain-containing protein [bacterium]
MADIRESIKQAYTEAVESAARDAGERLAMSDMTRDNYDEETLRELPVPTFGCGNPIEAALLKAGERVLDLGSGAGLDLLLAAKRVGAQGHVYGLDMTQAMLDKARKNIDRLSMRNITLLRGYIEEIPLHDGSVDVLLSNCVINLSPDKDRVFSEAFRVLTHGGRFCVSDVVLMKKVPEKLKNSPAAWSG